MRGTEYIRIIRQRASRKNKFLNEVAGVIHVGANTGQERRLYAAFRLDVAWIEPIPSVFAQLRGNLAEFPRQRAFQYLVTDRDEHIYDFHIASNEGQSSSILPLANHRNMFPKVYYSEELKLRSITLASLMKQEALDPLAFQALVLDTQGSELMVLRGATTVLPHFRFVKVEVPDFESYKGCCVSSELSDFMTQQGFSERRRDAFCTVRGVGAYFDVLYERTASL